MLHIGRRIYGLKYSEENYNDVLNVDWLSWYIFLA